MLNDVPRPHMQVRVTRSGNKTNWTVNACVVDGSWETNFYRMHFQ